MSRPNPRIDLGLATAVAKQLSSGERPYALASRLKLSPKTVQRINRGTHGPTLRQGRAQRCATCGNVIRPGRCLICEARQMREELQRIEADRRKRGLPCSEQLRKAARSLGSKHH